MYLPVPIFTSYLHIAVILGSPITSVAFALSLYNTTEIILQHTTEKVRRNLLKSGLTDIPAHMELTG